MVAIARHKTNRVEKGEAEGESGEKRNDYSPGTKGTLISFDSFHLKDGGRRAV